MSEDDSILDLPPADATASPAAEIRLAAMNLLARREHSARELQQKLERRFADRDSVATEVARLASENLQSDQRFAEGFVRQRVDRRQGPLRIRQEARARGLTEEAVNAVLDELAPDWFALAAEALQRKFGSAPPRDRRERARRLRFMQYRGFDTEHYRDLL